MNILWDFFFKSNINFLVLLQCYRAVMNIQLIWELYISVNSCNLQVLDYSVIISISQKRLNDSFTTDGCQKHTLRHSEWLDSCVRNRNMLVVNTAYSYSYIMSIAMFYLLDQCMVKSTNKKKLFSVYQYRDMKFGII